MRSALGISPPGFKSMRGVCRDPDSRGRLGGEPRRPVGRGPGGRAASAPRHRPAPHVNAVTGLGLNDSPGGRRGTKVGGAECGGDPPWWRRVVRAVDAWRLSRVCLRRSPRGGSLAVAPDTPVQPAILPHVGNEVAGAAGSSDATKRLYIRWHKAAAR